MEFSGDGSTLLTVSSFDEELKLWDASTGTLLVERQGIREGAVSPDANALAQVTRDEDLLLVDRASGQELVVRRATDGAAVPFTTPLFAPDGSVLLGQTSPGRMTAWDVSSGVPLGAFEAGPSLVVDAVYQPDGTQVAFVSASGQVEVWNTSSWAREAKLAGQRALRSYGVAFSPDGARLVTAGDGGAVVWDTSTWRRLLSLPAGPDAKLKAIRFLADGRTLAQLEQRTGRPGRFHVAAPWRIGELPAGADRSWRVRYGLWKLAQADRRAQP